MASITLKSVRKVFGDSTVAVNDVSLEIDSGEFVVFVGPSGCGKSTLLRMIAGLEAISQGQISIGGRVINKVPARDRDVAMVFQNYALYPHMSVRENIGFALEQRGMPRAEIDQRVSEVARILDLSALMNRRPKQLSGGQRQRVAMGRAIVRHPQAFLLDEPLSNLDAKLRVQMRAELGRLHSRLGVTTIHVTHDQIEAMTLGHRVAVFSRGTLQQYAPPDTIYHEPVNVFVAGFVGSPAMNFLQGALNDGGSTISVGKCKIPVSGRAALSNSGADDQVLVGIRPEHLRWRPAGAADASVIPATVELVERLEPESYVVVAPVDPAVVVRSADEYVRNDGEAEPDLAQADARVITLRVAADNIPKRGDLVDIMMAPDRIHLFDAVTGATMSWSDRVAGPIAPWSLRYAGDA
jgi:multiple sugar transport system ATP-binding protein